MLRRAGTARQLIEPTKKVGGYAKFSEWTFRVVSVVALLTLILLPSHAAISDLSVGNYQLISSTRVTRTIFDYTYKATLTNPGPVDVLNLTATVKSKSGKTTITDNTIHFGDVPAGQSSSEDVVVDGKVTNTDTFTIRQDRNIPFDPTDLVWTVSGNSRPVANAGADQTKTVGSTVQLDGSTSSDMDGDELTFHWTLLSKPTGSAAALSSTTIVNPTFAIDKAGTYEFQLIVNDGSADSAPDTVKISTTNSAPTADAGKDQTVLLGSLVTLDGSGSSDPDNDPLTYQWSFVTVPQNSTATLTNPTTVNPTFTADKPGAYHVRLIVSDGKVQSTEDIVIISTENSAPVANAGPDLIGTVNKLVQLDGSASKDADGNVLSYQWSFVSVPDTSKAVLSDTMIVNPTFTPDIAGMYVVQLVVNDGKLDSAPDSAKVTVTVGGGGCTAGNTQACYSGPAGTQGVGICKAGTQTCGSDGTFGTCIGEVLPSAEIPGNAVDENCDGLTPECSAGATRSCYSGPAGTQGVGICKAGTQTCGTNGAFGSYTGQVLPGTEIPDNGIDEDCNGADQTTGPQLPPDPSKVAPPVALGVTTTIGAATQFLYTGSNPIQTGVNAGTIEPRRAAVIRGKVLDKSNAPLPGVTITILNHPEFGQTLSRADGMFDLAVNGGGLLTVHYSKAGLLSAQRQIDVPWQDFAFSPDVVLIPIDAQVTTVDLTAAVPIQVARGSVMTDAAGTRQATVLFPQGTQATMVLPDGSTHPLATLHVRATEYSVGPNGPKAMPAQLPPTSAYTYAVELSADEAITAGAGEVRFNQPLSFYVENFLNFPIGMVVPTGFYDKSTGVWVPSDNGRVVKILSITAGLAEIDTDGDGTADNGSAIGLTQAERQQLATQYVAGQSLWRVPITHFSPYDCNWPYVPPSGAKGPPFDSLGSLSNDTDCVTRTTGSIIECQTQILGEEIEVSGTPFILHYTSDRVPGRTASRSLVIRLSGTIPPTSLKRIELTITVAGQRFVQSFSPLPNQTTSFAWDGKDAYQRTVQGVQPVTVQIGYVYDAIYAEPGAAFEKSFAAFSGIPIASSVPRGEVTLFQEARISINSWDTHALEIGGWSVNVHHTYDPVGKILYQGDGRRRSAANLDPIITTVAGGGAGQGNGIPATQANVGGAGDVAVGPDGTFYIAATGLSTIQRVSAEGIFSTIAGKPVEQGFNGDGGPAAQALLYQPRSVALGSDGSLYISDTGNGRIRKISTNGIITTVAGNGQPPCTPFSSCIGDGGLATQATLNNPQGIAVGPDGSLYIADQGSHRIRRVSPDGTITTVAGSGNSQPGGFSGDGGPATQARLRFPQSVTVGADGSLYIADLGNGRVRRVGPDGIITTVAGNGDGTSSGDGGVALEAGVQPFKVAVERSGQFYIADANRARKVNPVGIISTVAGNGLACSPNQFGACSGDDSPATRVSFFGLAATALGPDNFLYTTDFNQIRQVRPLLPGFSLGQTAIASEDGAALYIFDGAGRHLKTLNTLTGAVLYQFQYDAVGHLTQIIDGNK